MRITSTTTDEAALQEIGSRLARRRLDRRMPQATLAQEAGVSKRTIERLEAGESTQLASFLRVLRVLDLFDALDVLVAEQGPSPLELLRSRNKKRAPIRARAKRPQPKTSKPWTWGDEQ